MPKENNLLIYSDDKKLQRKVMEMEKYFFKIILYDPSVPGFLKEKMPEHVMKIVDLDTTNIDFQIFNEDVNNKTIYTTSKRILRPVPNLRYIMVKPLILIDLLRLISFAYMDIDSENLTEYKKRDYQIFGIQKNIVAESEQHLEIVTFEEISYFKAIDQSIEIHKSNGKTINMLGNLSEFQQILPENKFIKMSNTLIVNVGQVNKITRSEGYEMILASGERLALSKLGYEQFIKRFC
ncbi:LytTR family transcriptional regulator DNA-binding domain-containing protein [Flavobacterium sp. AG291]|uniref:LytTR family transcriptional regulator DNA-binding domain-containing protein n=1 Tax=Flavobacterium sp. AG291 TaxID=2184000 RepID=UPI000E0AB6A7|nr:LytTR family transcriptional regulator DNA-binding domain-containing protein [Flavobacterium sp. AG291]RDI11233.1 LytTr DNA-binding domain-containing protein [Flavobacterium sp. AG291]